VPARIASAADLEGVTDTLTAAFHDDPLWSWAFPDRSKMRPWWHFFMRSALRYPGIRVAGDFAAVAVWIPPDEVELTEEEEERIGPLLKELVGDRATEVMGLLESFEASHPRDRPHFYLSMLGTHPDHSGHGIGMGLLAESLATIDEEHMPAYLESSNPNNDKRYERLGFERTGGFTTPDGSRAVATMWRDGR
jgi:GNAT superfamily N-acetyltransferase